MPRSAPIASLILALSLPLGATAAHADPKGAPAPTAGPSPVAVGAVRCASKGKEGGAEGCVAEARAGVEAGLATLPAPEPGFEVSAVVEKAAIAPAGKGKDAAKKGDEGTAEVALIVKEKATQRLVAVVRATASVRGGTGRPDDLVRVAIRRAAETAAKRSAPVLVKKR